MCACLALFGQKAFNGIVSESEIRFGLFFFFFFFLFAGYTKRLELGILQTRVNPHFDVKPY